MTTPTAVSPSSRALVLAERLQQQLAVAPSVVPWQSVVAVYVSAALDSPHTQRAYGRALMDAFSDLGVATVSELSGAHLAAYRAAATGEWGWSPAVVAQQFAALRSFLRWSRAIGAHTLTEETVRAALRTPSVKVQKPYEVASEPEIVAMLAAADTPRDRALLAVLLGGGLRAAELVNLDVSDVREDGEGGTALYVRQGKGRKDRTVPLQPDVARLVRAYLAATGRRLGDDGPLFRAHDRGAPKRNRPRLSTRSVGYLVSTIAARAGIEAKTLSPHSLRHTYALRALRRGGNVVAVSKLLGHANVSTTSRYLDHLQLEELRAVVPALPVGDA